MTASRDLFAVLKEYLRYLQDREPAIGYLTYQPSNGKWSFMDGSIVDHVWGNFNNPAVTIVLRLEPDAVVAAIAADPPENLIQALTHYATFIASRPQHTGLHHFIAVDEPNQLKQERPAPPTETVN